MFSTSLLVLYIYTIYTLKLNHNIYHFYMQILTLVTLCIFYLWMKKIIQKFHHHIPSKIKGKKLQNPSKITRRKRKNDLPNTNTTYQKNLPGKNNSNYPENSIQKSIWSSRWFSLMIKKSRFIIHRHSTDLLSAAGHLQNIYS